MAIRPSVVVSVRRCRRELPFCLLVFAVRGPESCEEEWRPARGLKVCQFGSIRLTVRGDSARLPAIMQAQVANDITDKAPAG